MNKTRVLITSVGRRNYIVEYFQEILEEVDDLYVLNSFELSAGMVTTKNRIVAPEINSSKYIPFLLEMCKSKSINLIVSLFDQDLIKLSANKKKFKEIGVKLAVSDLDVIKKTFDKYEFAGLLNKIGLQSPKTFTMDSDFFEKVKNGEIDFPIILKPRWGTGSINTQKVENVKELNFFHKYLDRELSKTYISEITLFENKNEILAQEFIQGVEFNLDIINDLEGNYVTTFIKQKLNMRSGETDSALTIKDTRLERVGKIISETLNHVGNLDLDLIVEKNGRIFIIDANPRFGGGYPFSHIAGANIPACLISWTQSEVPKPEWLELEYGVEATKGIKLFKK